MPTNNSRDTLFRQWNLLQSIPREPQSATIQDIHHELKAQGYTVTKRTVERDLQHLLLAGFPLCVDDSSQPHLWSWSRHAPAMMLPVPTVSDAVLLVAARQYLRPLLPPMLMRSLEPYMERAAEILATAEKSNSLARWNNKIRVAPPTQPLMAPKVAPDILEPICSALMQETQLLIRYRSRSGKGLTGVPDDTGASKEMTVHPHALVHRGVVSYLIGTVNGYEDLRMFAMHRIGSAVNTYSPMKASPGFSLDAYLAEGFADFGKGEKKQLRMRVAPEVATHLTECKLSHDQSLHPAEQPEGWFELTATVHDTPQLEWWIRGFGERIQCLE